MKNNNYFKFFIKNLFKNVTIFTLYSNLYEQSVCLQKKKKKKVKRENPNLIGKIIIILILRVKLDQILV